MKKSIAILYTLLLAFTCYAQKTITVRTVPELLNAIGSGKTIQMEKGDYNLTEFSGQDYENVKWSSAYDGADPIIENVSDCTIKGREGVKILVSPRYSWVLVFANCSDITLERITFGHTEGGYCTGGVLKFETCSDIDVKNCKLFGSGTYGMELTGCSDVSVTDCDIYECTYGLLVLSTSTDVEFENTSFRKTGEFDLISITSCKSVNFKSCRFEENFTGEFMPYLFRLDQNWYSGEKMGNSSQITINNCKFTDNKIGTFCNDISKLKLGDNQFLRNDFGRP